MFLPLISAGTEDRGRRWAAVFLLVIVAATAPAGRPRAQQPDPYAATVTVNATAADTAKARELARADGQRRALIQVIAGLSGGVTTPSLAKLDDAAVTDMVRSFAVANERMSPVRYTADYTFRFRPAAVQRLMQRAGIAVRPAAPAEAATGTVSTAAPGMAPSVASGIVPGETGRTSRSVVVLPVYQGSAGAVLWSDPNPWRDAWASLPAAAGSAALTVPLGDASDVAAIDEDAARAGSAAALTAIGRKNNADEVVVTVATPRRQGDQIAGVEVVSKRYRQGQLIDTSSRRVNADPGEGPAQLLGRAAAAVATVLENGPSRAAALPNGPLATLDATVAITSLDDWLRVHDRLRTLPAIRKVGLMALSRQEATIEVQYVGTIDQLEAGLAGIGLGLTAGNPLWQITRPGAPP